MAVGWLQVVDAVLGVANFARGRASRVATDRQQLDLEREEMDLERQRAERALKIELLRQTGEREIGRLGLVAGVAVAAWIGTLILGAILVARSADRAADPGAAVRVALGFGLLLLLAALACAFTGQARVSAALGRIDGAIHAALPNSDHVSSGAAGAIAPWLIVAGLAVAGLAVLLI